MASHSEPDGDLGFQIAPMVDVVFVLMLFFMASTGMVAEEKQLHAQTPSGVIDGRTPPVAIVIEISEAGAVSVNSKLYGAPLDGRLSGLRDWLRDTRAVFGVNDPVVIRPAPGVRHQRVMQVLEATTAAQVRNVTLS